MKKTLTNILIVAILTFMNTACSTTRTKANFITLQHPLHRTVITCYKTMFMSAEYCAANHEAKGYVRLLDKTKMPAKYDLINNSTYPSRRWREEENSPRW